MFSANALSTTPDQTLDPSWVVLDPAMLRLHETAAAVAGGDLSVLIVGETGAGKEIVAEAIHRRSPRRRCSWRHCSG